MGVEYTPPLSVTRRATLRLDVSPSMFEIPESASTGLAPTATARRLYPLQGEAGVEYPFRLKWRAGASYRRSVEYVAGLSEPDGDKRRADQADWRDRPPRRRIGVWRGTPAPNQHRSRRQTTSALTPVRPESGTRCHVPSRSTRNTSTTHYDLSEHAPPGAAGLPGVYEQRGIRVGFTFFGQPLGR